MKHLEIRFTGIEHYLLAKARFTTLLNERGLDSRKTEESDVEKSEESEEGGANTKNQLAEITLEDLEATLEACKESYTISVDHGSKILYLVNGVFLWTPVSLGMCVQGKMVTMGSHVFPPFPSCSGRGATLHGDAG